MPFQGRRRGRVRAAALLAAAAHLFAPAAEATIFLPVSLEELVAASSLIFEGRVKSVKCHLERGGKQIYSLITVAPSRVHKGSAEGDIVIRMLGGRVGDLASGIVGAPRFRTGEEVFLFCSPHKASRGLVAVTSLGMGKFTVVTDARSGRKYLERKIPAGVTFRPDPEGKGLRPASVPARFERTKFIKAVKDAVAGREVRLEAEPEGEEPRPLPEGWTRGRRFRRMAIPVSTAAEEGSSGGGAALGLGSALVFFVLAALVLKRRARLRRTTLLLLLGAAAAGLGTLKAIAYERILTLDGEPVWWHPSSMPVQWVMNADETSDCAGELDVLKAAFDKWSTVPRCDLVLEYAGTVAENPGALEEFLNDGFNVVFWDSEDKAEFSTSPGALAFTSWTVTPSTGQILDMDIAFNDLPGAGGIDWTTTYQGGRWQVQGVAEHEIGHLIGLDHVDDPLSTLFGLWTPCCETLSEDEMDGARRIYPDLTPPDPPVITTNGGSDFTTTNTAVVLEGTAPDDAAVITVNGSTQGVEYVPGSGLWRFEDHLGPDTYPFVVHARDEDANASFETITVTIDPGGPRVLDFRLLDLGGGAGFTNADTVRVLADCTDPGGAVAGYLLTEDPGLAPDAAYITANGLDRAPRVYTFSNPSQGPKRVLLWIRDDSGNVSGPASAAIEYDWIPPAVVNVESVGLAHLLVAFSEPVSGALDPAAYAVAPAVACTGVSGIDPTTYLLTTGTLTSGQLYEVEPAPSVSDPAGNAALDPALPEGAQAEGDRATVGNIHCRTHWNTTVTYGERVLGAAQADNYRVVYADWPPYEALYLGGNTYELLDDDLYLSGDPDGYDFSVWVKTVTDVAGRRIEYTLGEDFYDGLFRVRAAGDIPPDSDPPVIDSFYLFEPGDRSQTMNTRYPTVGVSLQSSDPDGGVIRWLLTEDSSAPTEAEMRSSGSERAPLVFKLSESAGAHTAYAWVMDEDGNVAGSDQADITLLANSPPVAVIADPGPSPFEAAVPIDFDGTGSSDPDLGDTLSYWWDFGDGVFSTEEAPSHAYMTLGDFEVILVVTDPWGRTGTDRVTVTVEDNTPPVIDVPKVRLRGRVDTPGVTEVEVWIGGSLQDTVPVVDGWYEVEVDLTAGAGTVTLTLKASDGSEVGQRTMDLFKDGP